MKLDKSSFVPLYRQLVSVFYHRILAGIYPLHSLVPSQRLIAKEFAISLIVVRQAWQQMINENIIISQRGHGSIVNKLPDQEKFNHSIHGLSHDIGKQVTHQLISFSACENTILINQKFSANDHPGYLHLKRLRFVDSQPVSVENNYLNKKIITQFNLNDYNKSASLYSYLVNNQGIVISYADEKIQAILSGKEIAKILSVPVATPLLSVVRKTFCQQGLFEYTEYIIKSEFFGAIRYKNIPLE